MKPSHEEIEKEIGIRLSLQRALLTQISPQLRGVAFSVENQCVCIHFYFDGPISEDDTESVSCVETEVIADYYPELSVSAKSIRLDMPNPMLDGGTWVYLRREPPED